MSNSTRFHPSRREVLKSAGTGFGYLALAGLLGEAAAKAATADGNAPNPLAPKPPHFKPRAKRIIFVFMEGAMSTLDTVEYKPDLVKSNGQGTGWRNSNGIEIPVQAIWSDGIVVL